MTGSSMVATPSHRALGHVDFRLAAMMILGTVPGVEIGAQIIERLKDLGTVELVGWDFLCCHTNRGWVFHHVGEHSCHSR